MASEKDLDVWTLEKPEVLNYIYSEDMPDMWLSPITGDELHRCPWLKKYPNRGQYYCRINEVRPGVCRNYPVNVEQMISDGCEMLEPEDINKSTDTLMSELQNLRRVSNE